VSDSILTDPIELQEDVACTRCGYNLRGLTREGLCPECGTPILQSVRGDLLKFADPAWLDRLRFGTSLKLWNIGLMIVAGGAAGLLTSLGFPQILMQFVHLVGSALGLWASFAITAQEPRVALTEDPLTLRKIVRVCAVLGFLGSFLRLGAFPVTISPAPVLMISLTIVAILFVLAGVVAAFGELMYFCRFAIRIPDPALAKSTKTLMWLLPIAFVLVFGGGILVAVMAPNVRSAASSGGSGRWALGVLLFGCSGGLLFVISALWYVRLLTKYNRAFKEALAEARQGGT